MKNTPQSGLSLVEILVTLSIISLLMGAAVPQFQAMVEKNKVQALMDEFASSLYLVRGEAAKRGFHVSLCASNTAKTECDTSVANFSAGWIIFVDYDGDGLLDDPTILFDVSGDGVEDTPEELIFVSHAAAGSGYEVQSASGTAVTYRSNGQSDGGLSSYLIVKTGVDVELARVSINRTGRIYSKIIR